MWFCASVDFSRAASGSTGGALGSVSIRRRRSVHRQRTTRNKAHTMNCETAILLGVPILLLLTCPRYHNISSVLQGVSERWSRPIMVWPYLWVCLDLKPPAAEMAFTPEREYWRAVIVSYLLLLRIVSDTHSDVSIAMSAAKFSQQHAHGNGGGVRTTRY